MGKLEIRDIDFCKESNYEELKMIRGGFVDFEFRRYCGSDGSRPRFHKLITVSTLPIPLPLPIERSFKLVNRFQVSY